jgi:hypothetical protein
MDGCKSSERGLEPNLRSACSQALIVPGTPTPRPLVTRSSKGIGSPVSGSIKLSGLKASGAASRLSMVETLPYRGVGRVASFSEDLHSYLGGIVVHGGHGAARSGCGRLLGRLHTGGARSGLHDAEYGD